MNTPAGPPAYPTTPCSSCQAPIVWATTSTGRTMPVDAEPVDPVTGGGNVTLAARGSLPPVATVHGKPKVELLGAAWAYRPHFATCPYAARHRRPRPARGRR